MPDKITNLSRSATTNQFGKCTVDVKFVIPPMIEDVCKRLASGCGNWSEYLRDLLVADAFGQVGVQFHEPHPERDVEQSLAVLAFKQHMTTEEYKQKVLFEHVNGRCHAVRLPDSNS